VIKKIQRADKKGSKMLFGEFNAFFLKYA